MRALGYASKWGCKLSNWHATGIGEVVDGCIDPLANFIVGGKGKVFTTAFMSTLFYICWEHRNQRLFSGDRGLPQLVFHFDQMVEFLEASGSGGGNGNFLATAERWKLPPMGWFKVNTDTAFKEGKAAGAFIVRDEKGTIVRMASRLMTSESAFVAEVRTLEWASELIEKQGWNKVTWATDSDLAVIEILSKNEPEGWSTRHLFLEIKRRFHSFDWVSRLEPQIG